MPRDSSNENEDLNMLDLIIRGGNVIDGTGAPARRADLGIHGGRIAAIGKIDGPARETIDADGRVVCPGFIDVHTHYDAQIFWDPTLSPSCFHGVTTVIGGNCGFSIAPLSPQAGQYLLPMLARVEGMPVASLEAGVPWDWRSFGDYLGRHDGRIAINAGFLAGHSAIRRVVMGARAVGERATGEELARMKALLAESIAQGALGFSSTVSPTHNDADGNPVPSRHASREEILELAGVCRGFEGTAVEFLPNLLPWDEEQKRLMADISLAAGRPLNWNVLAANTAEIALIEDKLDASNVARARGAEVVALTVPQPMTMRLNFESGFLFDSFPGWSEIFRRVPAERMRRLGDPDFRRRMNADACSTPNPSMRRRADWSTYRVAETFAGANAPLRGRTIGDIASERHVAPLDAMLDIALADELRTSFVPETGGDDLDTWRLRGRLWNDDRTIIGASDAGAHLDMIDTFAFTTQVLGNGVRRYALLGLEAAIHKMTLVLASLYGLRERGALRQGWHADVVVFDPATVACAETCTRFDLPAGAGRLYADAIGVDHVIVNGSPIIRDGRMTTARPGTVLRSGRDTRTVDIPANRRT
ncbi:MAG: amidohydrolase family protein [Gammaproteobacteria bacterium]